MTQNSPKELPIIAVPSCLGAQDTRCDSGPFAVRNAGLEQRVNQRYTPRWQTLPIPDNAHTLDKDDLIYAICEQLARDIAALKQERFVILGGDHSCAIGTWSGLKSQLPQQNIGMIWIDAHMDSHLPETSPSQAIHGMPLACLLGHGEQRFCELGGSRPVLRPQHVCLIGIRSYEPEEAVLLDLLGVHVFTMHDVQQQGLDAVFQQALEIVKKETRCFGVSIDLDGIDPYFAPGVGSPEQDGLHPDDLLTQLGKLKHDPDFRGLEIVELNPARDIDNKTVNLCIDLVTSIY